MTLAIDHGCLRIAFVVAWVVGKLYNIIRTFGRVSDIHSTTDDTSVDDVVVRLLSSKESRLK